MTDITNIPLNRLESVRGGICQHCGRDYIGDILEGDCPAHDCPSYKARVAIAAATVTALPSPVKTITVHLEGGLVQDVIGVPKGYELHVEDHDEGDESHPSWDAEKECFVTIYEGYANG